MSRDGIMTKRELLDIMSKGFEKYKDKKQNTKGGNHISVAKSVKEKSSKKKK